MIWLRSDFRQHFLGDDVFDRILGLQGEVFRELSGRRTLRFILGGRGYFVKLHFGVGWREIFKNLLYGRLPVLGASHEWQAIRRLEILGIDTMRLVGYGQRGKNPARQESFVITEELGNTVSLEDLSRDWRNMPPDPVFKRALIQRVADISRILHSNGVNHRDFYICHFLFERSETDEEKKGFPPRLYVIDLHRTQLRRQTPKRWMIKDLAGLFFSSLDIGLTSRDFYRFLKCYRKRPLRSILCEEESFWRRVTHRAVDLYRRDFKCDPRLPIGLEGN